MTPPVPPIPANPPIPGQSALNDLKNYLENIVLSYPSGTQGLIGQIVGVLDAIIPILDPNHGKGAERDAYLSNLYQNKDKVGLQAFIDRNPAEPKEWIALAKWYLSLL